MRPIEPYPLWIGNVGDLRQPAAIADAGVRALVDLADSERPAPVFRDLVYCRFPLVDGAGNPGWLLSLTIETVAKLIREQTPTLVFCNGGMSRSPSVVAAALGRIEGGSPDAILERIGRDAAIDVAPALWEDVRAIGSSGPL